MTEPSDPATGPASAAPPSSPIASDDSLQPREAISPGITRRGMLIGVIIGIVAITVALSSVYFRRTRLERTTAFFGRPMVRALQSSSDLRLRIPTDGPLEVPEGSNGIVDLSQIPGHSMLRHALLDERHYDWKSAQQVPVEQAVTAWRSARQRGEREVSLSEPEWVTLELDGTPPGVENEPEGKIQPVAIKIELTSGWLGLANGNQSARLISRAAPAVRTFVLRNSNARTKRYDER